MDKLKLHECMQFDEENNLIARPDTSWQRYLNYYAKERENDPLTAPMPFVVWAEKNGEHAEIKST